MEKEDYVLRIASATPVQLVIINHELITVFITEALDALEGGDTEAYATHINRAKNGLTQLINGLDFEIEIAQELYDLYLYAGERLNRAYFGKDKAAAQEMLEMFQTLLEGWKAIEDTPDERVSTRKNAPQVYAGLTYGRDGLGEYVVEDENRGYKA